MRPGISLLLNITVSASGASTRTASSRPSPEAVVSGFTGDGGPATDAMFNCPIDVALDQDGNIYVCRFIQSPYSDDRFKRHHHHGSRRCSSTAEGIPATQGTIYAPHRCERRQSGVQSILLASRRPGGSDGSIRTGIFIMRRPSTAGTVYSTSWLAKTAMPIFILAPRHVGSAESTLTEPLCPLPAGGTTVAVEGEPAADTALSGKFFSHCSGLERPDLFRWSRP